MAREKKPHPSQKGKRQLKQTRIPGTFDPPPKEVQAAADAFVEAKRNAANWRVTMKERMDTLIGKMQEHGITEVEIDDGEKRLVLIDARKVQVAKKEAQEKEGNESAE